MRRLHQIGHFIEQLWFFGGLTVDARCRRFHQLGDALLALDAINHHALLRYSVKITVRLVDGEGRKFTGRQPSNGVGEARAAADFATADASPSEGHYLIPIKGHEPAHRTRKGNVAAIPAHGHLEAQTL